MLNLLRRLWLVCDDAGPQQPPYVDERESVRQDHGKLRYPSHPTREGWALVAPVIPLAKHRANKRTVNVRSAGKRLMGGLGTEFQIMPRSHSAGTMTM
jgi:hypothetical protein